jgi:hypothetical protein
VLVPDDAGARRLRTKASRDEREAGDQARRYTGDYQLVLSSMAACSQSHSCSCVMVKAMPTAVLASRRVHNARETPHWRPAFLSARSRTSKGRGPAAMTAGGYCRTVHGVVAKYSRRPFWRVARNGLGTNAAEQLGEDKTPVTTLQGIGLHLTMAVEYRPRSASCLGYLPGYEYSDQ